MSLLLDILHSVRETPLMANLVTPILLVSFIGLVDSIVGQVHE